MSLVQEKPSSTDARRRWAAEAALAAALFVAAYAVATWYLPLFIAAGGKPWFYQQEFGPAVMEACGLGYVNPAEAPPSLQAFLDRASDQVPCGDLQSVKGRPLTSMQRAFRYLMTTVGETWRLQGRVSWSALAPLFGVLYGLTTVLAFAVFRQGVGRVLAGMAAAALIVSTLHLNNLPHLRDYAKAPFVLALTLMAIRVTRSRMGSRATLAWAVAAGVVTGIGIGFRNDLLVAIPAFVAVFAVFLPGGVRERLALRAGSTAAYAVAVYVAMWPMSSVYTTGGGSSSQHLVLLGLTPSFSQSLGMDNSRLYEVGFEYRDELALAIIDNYADRRQGQHRFFEMYGAGYDRAASSLLREFAGLFPADLLARAYASAVRITELPHSTTTAALVVPAFLPPRAQGLLTIKADALRWLGSFWPWPLVITLGALSVISLRLGLFGALLVGYLSGYPALQFQERHYFHLEFIGWWVLVFAIALAGRGLKGVTSRERPRWLAAVRPEHGWPRAVALALAMWLALAAAVVLPLALLRQYQRGSVTQLLSEASGAPRTALDLVKVSTAGGSVRLEAPMLAAGLPPDGGVHAAYLVAAIGGSGCDATSVELTERYHAQTKPYDFTHSVQVPVPVVNTPTQVYFPAYFRNPSSTNPIDEGFGFAGVELAASSVDCLAGLSVVNTTAPLPVLLDLQLPPDWTRVTPHATISGIEWRQNPAAVHVFPENLSRRRLQQGLASDLATFVAGDIAKVSPTFTMDGAAWTVNGAGGVGGRGPLLYLVEMSPRRLARGALFVAEGTIEKGGVTFGLVRDDQWIVQLHVVRTGDFAVGIEVPEDGDYKVVMANNLRGMSLQNHLQVRKAGLLAPPVPGGGQP